MTRSQLTTVAVFLAIIGFAVGVAGVYVLAGLGWSLIAAMVPPMLMALVLVRGMGS